MVRPREGARLPELRETSDGLTDRKNNICDRIPAFTPGSFLRLFSAGQGRTVRDSSENKKKTENIAQKITCVLVE